MCITAFLIKQTQLQIVCILLSSRWRFSAGTCFAVSVSLPGQWPQPLLVLGHPCGCYSRWLYPEGQRGAPQVLFFSLGSISHTAFPSPVKRHNITCLSCSFSGAVRNQFSDRSQLSGALVEGGGDTALPACPAGTERSIPETLAVLCWSFQCSIPGSKRGIQCRGETWVWAPAPLSLPLSLLCRQR